MFFWARFPFVRVALFFTLGILFGINYPTMTTFSQIGLGISLITLIILLWQRNKWVLKFNYLYGINLSMIFLFFGYTAVSLTSDANSNNHLLRFGSGSYYTSTVISPPQIKGNYLRLIIEAAAVKDSSWQQASGKVLAYFRLPINNLPGYGDKLVIKGFPKRVPPPLNPNEFDYRKYLAYKDIRHQHFVDVDSWYLYDTASGFNLRRISINARKFLEKKLSQFIPQADELAIAKALILGNKEDLTGDTKELYAQAGAMHVLAVSGLHVGIIYLVLLGLLRQKHGRVTNPVLVALIVIPILWAYAFITGLSPSVLRAVTMFSFLALAQVMNRRSASLNTLAISAFILLLINPYMIMAVGFQLSYVAVIGIIFLYPMFEKLLNPANPVVRFAWQITALSLAAQLATSPLAAFYFHRFPTYFLFSNLLVIPAATIIVWGGLALLTIGSVSSAAGIMLGKILSMIIWLLNQALHWLTLLPKADIHSLATTFLETGILYGLIIALFLYFSTRKWLYYRITVVLLIIFGLAYSYSNLQSNNLRQVVFYSVNSSWALDLVDHKSYYYLADSVLLKDTAKIDYHLMPYRRQNGLSPLSSNPARKSITDLGEVVVWHGTRILLANPCLEEKDIPLVFDFVLYKAGRTPQNCYQEQILLRKFVNNRGLSYTKYNLRAQGALIVDI